eukprot:snap_masked-scaffold_30-processed-gene-3.53-mRNA-1 protein AED:1.00 eAED:1.00 QI:0/-1/0/0/-1/1/1/0/119
MKKGDGFRFKKKFKNFYFKKRKGGGLGSRIYISKKKGRGVWVQGLYISRKKKGGGFGFKDLCPRFKTYVQEKDKFKNYSSVNKVVCEKFKGERLFSPFPFLLLTLFLGDSNIIPLSSET